MEWLLTIWMVTSDGYVLRSASVDAEPGRVGFTVTFDNIHLPEMGGNCLEICVVE